jgi:hypothetical protein
MIEKATGKSISSSSAHDESEGEESEVQEAGAAMTAMKVKERWRSAKLLRGVIAE